MVLFRRIIKNGTPTIVLVPPPTTKNSSPTKGEVGRGGRTLLPARKKPSSNARLFLCHIVLDHRTFINDYLKIVEFIEWLKDFYPEKAKFLTKKS